MAQFIISLLAVLSSIVAVFYWNRTVYSIVGFFATRKFAPAKNYHKYAVLVAARNEETVIGNLIDSIKKQDYPSDLIDIFVVADNCTDATAAAATRAGAVCYERQDPDHRTKGFALQYLVECIRRDYGIDSYEGYFIFDADNLLKVDFVSRMNDAFDAGEKIVTSYRNSKNFDTNWISASYSIHWLRTVRQEHRARSLLRSATRIQGTGFLFAWELIEKGWNYTSLTEDRAFCADAVVNGYRISYNHDAIFYDEQPVDLRIALRQRLRWAKGHLMSFVESGGKLFLHMFVTKDCARPDLSWPKWKRVLYNLHIRYLSADMLSVVYPRGMLSLLKQVLIYILRITMIFSAGYLVTISLGNKTVRIFAEFFGLNPIPGSVGEKILMLTVLGVLGAVVTMVKRMFTAAYIMFLERKRTVPMAWYKRIWFCFMFPWFDTIGKFASCIALFTKVEWKPIPHKADVRMEELAEKTKR